MALALALGMGAAVGPHPAAAEQIAVSKDGVAANGMRSEHMADRQPVVRAADVLPPLCNVVGVATREAVAKHGDFLRAVLRALRGVARRLHRVLDPLFATYYAVPMFAFYPLLIVLFGLGDAPQIMIGFMLAVVAVIVSTLRGLDSVPDVLLKTVRIYRMGQIEAAWRVTLPHATPQLVTGVKLALAYAFAGVIGAEFIMSRDGLGYEINFAFNNFDNSVMPPSSC